MGGGAAGITLAMELLNSGLNIILLEAGGETYDAQSQALYSAGNSHSRYPANDISRLRFFGGSSNHWEGSCAPLGAIDFEKRDWVPHSGWPISRQDLDPYYERAQRHLDLGPYHYDLDYWERNSTLRPLSRSIQHIATSINQHSTTRFATKYRAALKKASNIRVILNANVVAINESRPVDRVETVDFKVLNGVSGSVTADLFVLSMGGIENSRMLLLSNGVSEAGIGNEHDNLGRYYMDHPVIKSAYIFPTSEWPKEFSSRIHSSDANVSVSMELTPETLRSRHMSNARLPLVDKSEYQVSEGVESLHQLKNAMSGKGEVESYFKHLKNIVSNFDMVAEAISRKKFDSILFDDSESFGGYLVDAMIEQIPVPENRIVLSNDVDALGLRKLFIQWRLSEYDKSNIKSLAELLGREVTKTGLATVRTLIGAEDETERGFNELMNFGYHHMGGTRMSAHPRNGVVDKNQKIFFRKNLYVAGSSVFPTGGHVPPTLTIVAMTIRLADHIKRTNQVLS
jgi:choline dehydrogenase-like flavoprotein